jgi:hypothetical protein
MTKIYLATPAYDGKVNVQYAISMAETANILQANGVPMRINISTSGSLLVAERNRLVKAFLETDCTHMLCIDSDLGWPAQAVAAMLMKDKEFIAGVYPSRKENVYMFRPSLMENGSVICDKENGLLKMEYIPAGFMLLKRSVLEKMIAKFPETEFVPKDKVSPSGHCLFNTEVWDGEFWGEDYVFCRRAREAGIDIWVDPLIQFDHNGVVGCMTSVLTDKPPEENKG